MTSNIMKSKNRGQGMTEYVIIVALVAIAVLGAVKTFGNVVDTEFKTSTTKLNQGFSGESKGD